MIDQTSVGSDSALVVERALTALKARDFDTLEALLDDDVVYVNVGTPATRNRRSTMRVMRLTRFVKLEVEVHHTTSNGATVLNERTDAIVIGPLRLQFWAFGVFEVHGGRITLWRDYFDFYDFTRNGILGVVGVIIPAVRPSMP